MAYLPCDWCGKKTDTQGSWDTLITIICGPCYDKREAKKQNNTTDKKSTNEHISSDQRNISTLQRRNL